MALRPGIAPGDRVEDRSVVLDGQPRGGSQRGLGLLLRGGFRRCCLATWEAIEVVPPVSAPEAAGEGGVEAVGGLVAAADFGVAA